jgi:glycosyltransferase 2 family protein
LGSLLTRALLPLSERLAHKAGEVTSTFSSGLNVITNVKSLCQVIVLSLAIWFLISLAFLENIHAFRGLRHLSLAESMLLLGFSLLGSLVQLPGGGSQQLIVVAVLIHVFGVSAELAVSCSLLGWIAIFMAPVPAGLGLLRHERLSLRGFHSVPGSAQQLQNADP